MRRGLAALLVLAIACGSGGNSGDTSSEPAPEVGPPSTTDTAGVADAAPSADPPPAKTPTEPTHPEQDEALIAALPAIDFATPLSLGAGSDVKEARKRNRAGLAHHDAKRYPEAIVEYTAALAAQPGHLLARYNLACAYALAGEPDKGLALLHEMDTKDGCEECAGVVVHARGDDDWSAQWASPVFQAVMRYTEGQRYGPNLGAWWKDGCPAGSHMKKKPSGPYKFDTPEEFEGKVWCETGGKKHGPYYWNEAECHMGEGYCSAQGTYANGVKDGYWFESPNYYGAEMGYYVAGKRHGLWSEQYQGVETDKVYVDGEPYGAARAFDVHYHKRSVRIEYYESGKLHGEFKEWTDGGDHVLLVEGAYVHGAKHGTWQYYRSDGGREREETYEHGVRNGVYTYWNEAGAVIATTEMSDGNGDWVAYDDKGVLRERGTYAGGNKQGAWIEPGKYESYQDTGTYEDGVRVGAWKTTHVEDGKFGIEGAYAAGERDGAWVYRGWSGHTVAEGSFVAGQPDGTWVVMIAYDTRLRTTEYEFRRGALRSVDGERPTREQLNVWKEMRDGWGDDPRPIEASDVLGMPH